MIQGVWGFFKTISLLLVIMEFSFVVEEVFNFRLELRKGFAGAKSSILKTLSRHALKVLRIEGNFRHHFTSSLKFLVIIVAAGLLPSWGGQVAIQAEHSLWLFIGLVILGPIIHLVFEWLSKKGDGWPVVLTTAERTIGSATVLFVLSITLVAMGGADNFEDITASQYTHGWTVLRYPLALLLVFAFAVVSLFSSFQSIFSRTGDAKKTGWSLDDLLPHFRKTIWTLFIVDVFFGGAGQVDLVGDFLLVIKCVVLNLTATLVTRLFFQLREDQAEAFILWRLAPISILILALSLIFPGGLQ